MTIQEIYDLAISMGTKADPRGEQAIKKVLSERKKKLEKLTEKEKKNFDSESLKNPYSDTRILFGNPKAEVKKIMAGIDADASEVLITDRLREKGEKIDLLISHHPSGHALASLQDVMDLQIDMFSVLGVPENVADSLMRERMTVVKRRISPLNHSQAVDAAKLLNVPLLALHTVWDNMGNYFMTKYITDKTFETAGDVLEYVREIPEFAEAARGKSEPFLAAGSPDRRVGKIAVGFTGGTSASKELYVEMVKAGVGTLVEMHFPEEALEEARKLHLNIIDCGHMAADSIGANIFLDELERRGVTVIPCSGLIRVNRKDKVL